MIFCNKGFGEETNTGTKCEPSRKDQRGPSFRTEPSAKVEFSNSSGTELRCNADGTPTPRLSWQVRDGTGARDVPGIRYTRSDGTLVFPPFSRSDYRQEVHDSVYQCVAANTVGSVVSREVHVRGDASDVPGIRYTRSEGTLAFPPFSRSDYSQEVDDSVYQCVAANTVGSVVSKEVYVRGGMSKTIRVPEMFLVYIGPIASWCFIVFRKGLVRDSTNTRNMLDTRNFH
ncbi:hypothetical protein JTE90_019065 [Oedothorax gibbosus]|uniref:Ig-like domain-containing protein n=1 Tax=Oedothorax gibbosus TaxID=931172 RepID=A0AAV6UYI2_9ARAC|nr:hypothetical protein JTE90_019065 [Oedothorax gibbosus]